MAQQTWQWSRNAPATHEEAWRERLSFLGPEQIAVHGRPGSKTIRLEVYAARPSVPRRLEAAFGGRVKRLDAESIAARANAPRRPLRIGRAVGIIDTHGSWPAGVPRPRILLRIAGAMAFGTGEHATTSACLRFLADEARQCDAGWSCLDLGTGSGILAIAAEKLGAGRAHAIDCDPRAVRAAQTNARRNHCRRVRISAGDLLRWKPAPAGYRVVLANVFSEILRAAAPRIARSVEPGGCLILSGILRPQEKEVRQAFRARRLKFEEAARRGKWVTLRWRAR